MREREAAKLQRGLADERRSVEELEAKLSQLQRCANYTPKTPLRHVNSEGSYIHCVQSLLVKSVADIMVAHAG